MVAPYKSPTGVGGALTAPAPAGAPAQAAPPDRVGRWRAFLNVLQNDPNARMALLQLGTGLMQTPQVGQSGWDVAGQALQRSAMTLDQLRERDRQQKESELERERQYGLEARRTGAVEQQAATSAKTGEAYVTSTGTQTEIAKRKADVELSPERQAAELAGMGAETGLRKAQTAEAYAQAAREKAMAGRAQIGARGPGGLDVQSAEAIAQRYIDQGMDPVEARDRAAREVYAMKGQRQSRLSQDINDRATLYGSMSSVDLIRNPELGAQLRQQAADDVVTEYYSGRMVAVTDPRSGQKKRMKMGPVKGGVVRLTAPDGSMMIVPVTTIIGELNAPATNE